MSACGTIGHYGQVYSVGARFKGQFVQLKFEAESQACLVFDNQALIKTIEAQYLAADRIQKLTVCQRTSKSSVSHEKSIT